MKIISKFNDYYDGCSYYCGQDLTYVRNLNEGYYESTSNGNIWRYNRELLAQLKDVFKNYKLNNVTFIGEKIVPFYPLLTTPNSDKPSEQKWEFYFTAESTALGIAEYYAKDPKSSWRLEPLELKREAERLNNHFTLSHKHHDCYKAIRKLTNAPIVSCTGYRNLNPYGTPGPICMHEGVTLNPILKELRFHEVVPTYEVIQELEMFMNKLKFPESSGNFTNSEKIHQAGFNKHSFRKA